MEFLERLIFRVSRGNGKGAPWSTTSLRQFFVTLLSLFMIGIAVLSTVVPIVFLCSAHREAGSCPSTLRNFSFVESLGGYYVRHFVLHEPRFESAVNGGLQSTKGGKVEREMLAGDANTPLHALFEYVVAIGGLSLFTDFWSRQRNKLYNLPDDLRYASAMLVYAEKDEPNYISAVERRVIEWEPMLTFSWRVTVVFSVITFVLTAFIVGNILMRPFARYDLILPYSSGSAVSLAINPFLVIANLTAAVMLVTLSRLLIAPRHYAAQSLVALNEFLIPTRSFRRAMIQRWLDVTGAIKLYLKSFSS